MHNVNVLMKGKSRCTLQIHPDDAGRLGLGDEAKVTSRAGAVVVAVEVTDAVMPGVVSLPHGWGHADSARWQKTAGRNAGVSVNDWIDDTVVEPIIGQSILNGVPVRLAPTVTRS